MGTPVERFREDTILQVKPHGPVKTLDLVVVWLDVISLPQPLSSSVTLCVRVYLVLQVGRWASRGQILGPGVPVQRGHAFLESPHQQGFQVPLPDMTIRCCV